MTLMAFWIPSVEKASSNEFSNTLSFGTPALSQRNDDLLFFHATFEPWLHLSLKYREEGKEERSGGGRGKERERETKKKKKKREQKEKDCHFTKRLRFLYFVNTRRCYPIFTVVETNLFGPFCSVVSAAGSTRSTNKAISGTDGTRLCPCRPDADAAPTIGVSWL